MRDDERAKVAALLRACVGFGGTLGDVGDRFKLDEDTIRIACEAHGYVVQTSQWYDVNERAHRDCALVIAAGLVERGVWP